MNDPHVDRRADRVFRPIGLGSGDLEHYLALGRAARAKAFSGFARSGVAAVKGLIGRRRP